MNKKLRNRIVPVLVCSTLLTAATGSVSLTTAADSSLTSYMGTVTAEKNVKQAEKTAYSIKGKVLSRWRSRI